MAIEDEQQEPDALTDFGYERVPWNAKSDRVRGVFDSVAPRYDLMNDVMSFGLHRAWKAFTVARTGLRAGQSALDVAAGSGDLTTGLAKRVGPRGLVVATDINARMLALGRDRLLDRGIASNVAFAQADAEALPFARSTFHCITIGFGLRNVTDKSAALASMFRVLKPGGRLLVLEFSKPNLGPLEWIYDGYSMQVLPRLGRWLARDDASYRYLAQSIRRHPDQRTLLTLMEEQGFERCEHFNLSAGIVALHIGYRL
jgi:demethylmenaquinone methyltransferase / 2-methoxy-6-polyprenyl-1,4-benzoquinol methylase